MISEIEKIDFILKEGLKKGMVLSKFINTEINEFKESEAYKFMLTGSRYYKNNGDIKNKERTYIDEDGIEKVSPHAVNTKLHHPILYKMINQKAGYLLRKKPTIKPVIDNNEEENSEYKKILNDLFNNKMHKRLKYTLIEAVKRGIAWWQVYIDEKGDLKVRLRYATRIIPIWEDEEHEVLAAVIMIYDVEVYTSETEKEKKTKVEYWDLDGVRYYVLDGSNLIEDVEEVEKRKDLFIKTDSEGISILGHFAINGIPQLWDKLPFVYWKYNGDELPLIYFLKTLVDAYDYLTSKTADAIYETPDGVNVVKNYADDPGKFQKNLQTLNTIFLDKDGEYDRKSPKIEIEAYKTFIEQLRKDIYESGFCVDTQSEKFGTNLSGVAIKQLYADLDLDCSNIETEFKSSLEYFMYFVNSWAQEKYNKDYMENEIELIFNKTMTVNEAEIIECCKNSVGMISNASIVAHHPWVSNAEDELKKIKDEENEALGNYMNNNQNNQDNDNNQSNLNNKNKDGDVDGDKQK